nr:unnamed protein product [Callosobruchus analis]
MKQRLLLLLLRLEAELDEKVSPATSTPVERMPPAPVFSSPKPILPYKWNISFKGTPDESVISFLEKVESMRLSRCVQKNELFLSAGDLFKDKAWIWFNVNRPRCSSPRSVFCFGCGSQGVIRPKCPKCSGNGKGGSATLDDATTPVQGPAQAEAPAQSSLDRRKKSQKGKPQQN